MRNSLVTKKWPEKERFPAETHTARDQSGSMVAKGIEIILGLVFLTLALWLGIQAWRTPLVFDWAMLVVSEAALVGGPLWLWSMLQE
jgi:hypothetical protein